MKQAAASMVQTAQARGEGVHAEIWGPSSDGAAWQFVDSIDAAPGAAEGTAGPGQEAQPVGDARQLRMSGRRHELLLSVLARVGITRLESEDNDAIAKLVDSVSEDTVRGIGRWLRAARKSR